MVWLVEPPCFYRLKCGRRQIMKQLSYNIAALRDHADQVAAITFIATIAAKRGVSSPLQTFLPLIASKTENNTYKIDSTLLQRLCDTVLTEIQTNQLSRRIECRPSKRYRRCMWCCVARSHANVRSVSTAGTPAAADLIT